MYNSHYTSSRHSRQPSSRVIRPSIIPHMIDIFALVLIVIATVCLAGRGVGPYQVLFVVVLVWVPVAAKHAASLLCAKYEMSKDLIVANIGLLSRRIIQVRASDIRSIAMKQGIFGRMLGYGDVVIFTAATSGAEIVMRAVPNPAEIVATLDAIRGAAK